MNEQGHENAQFLNLVFIHKLTRRDLKTDFRIIRSPDDLFSYLSPNPGGKRKIIATENRKIVNKKNLPVKYIQYPTS